MAKKYTILQFADRIEKLSKGLNKAVLPPFRANLKIMRAALYAEYWKHPLGKKIWEWRQRKWNLTGGPVVGLGTGRRPSYARWSQSEKAFTAAVYVDGLAAKIDLGGRLRRHVIFGRAVREGQLVPRRPVFDEVIDKLWKKNVDDVSKSFWNFVEKTL